MYTEHKPSVISRTKETVIAEYICPSCCHRIVINGDKETVNSFWN